MNQVNTQLCRGDMVEVLHADEILRTLDSEGAVDRLPFMPEMLSFCGQRFRVAARALTVCISGPGSPRGFRNDDVVTLEGVRCSGEAHDGCQKACMIFWREAWLRKVESLDARSRTDMGENACFHPNLKTSTGPKTYYCQASELSKSTEPLSRQQRLTTYINGLRVGNYTGRQMVKGICLWLFWRIRRTLMGVYPSGNANALAVESLGLQPGEWVKVKSLKDIIKTLNERGQNRGLRFSPDMRLACGKRLQVKGRIDKLIVDGTGEMRQLQNTVCLEGSTCGCSYMGFGLGGCSRCEYVYWREAWLRRGAWVSAKPTLTHAEENLATADR
jgi:hypothetical protein